MKLLPQAVLFLFSFSIFAPAYAELSLPDKDDKSGWNNLIEVFSECSAVYNLAASVKEKPEQGTSTYRELANNALVAGMYSAEHLGLGDSYLESIYSTKFSLWQKEIKDKSQTEKVTAKAEQCLKETLPLQNKLVGTLRYDSTTHK